MKLFNLKNGNKETMPQRNIPVIPSEQVVIIHSKQYIIEKVHKISAQPYTEDIRPYGWTLELGHDIHGKIQYYDYTKKVYTTRESAIQAMIQIKKQWGSGPDRHWRISALYRMDTMDWRDYLIKEIFREEQPCRKYEMKFWKVREDSTVKSQRGYEFKAKKGQVYVQYEDGVIGLLSTPTEIGGYGNYRWTLDRLLENDLVEEVDIITQKWIHPHLPIQLKNKYNVR